MRMQEARPTRSDETIQNHRFHGFAVTGDPLDHAIGFVTSPRRVEDDQFPLTRRIVVTAHHRDHLGRVTGNGPGVEECRGPEGIAAVVFHLPAAVGVRVKEQAGEGMGNIGILPALVEEPAVVQHRGTPVVILVVRQAADAPVVIAQVEIGHLRTAADAGDADERRRGREDDAVVRQITGVVIVHVRLVDERERLQRSTVQVQLGDAPAAALIGGRQQQGFGVIVQIQVPDESVAVGTKQGLDPASRRWWRQAHQGIAVAGRFEIGIAVVVHRQSQPVRPSPDHQQAVKVQQRIGQQRLALKRLEARQDWGKGIGARVARKLVVFGLKRVELLLIAAALRVAAGEFQRQVIDGQT